MLLLRTTLADFYVLLITKFPEAFLHNLFYLKDGIYMNTDILGKINETFIFFIIGRQKNLAILRIIGDKDCFFITNKIIGKKN